MRNCYLFYMSKIKLKTIKWSGEGKVLVVLSILLAGVLATSWIYAMNVRQAVVANNAVVNVDPAALIEVEKIRNLADSQIDTSRSFFLLGSKTLFDKQKEDKQTLLDAVASFQKKYNLPQVPEKLKRIEAAIAQNQDFFDQAMEHREKKTESKIVGQFYQSKTGSIRKQINDSLDEVVALHKAELERAQTEAKKAASDVEFQIPQGMLWLTGAIAALFLCMALLVIRMIRQRSSKMAERERLYNEAKTAVQSRDEVISAITHDLKEPLSEIHQAADKLVNSSDRMAGENAELIKSSVVSIEDAIRDICDQKTADMGGLTLRLDQLSVDEILDDARLILQPLAKKRDIRLQFDSVNPPVLAFFDRERVIRVLSNLVGNAIKFSPKHSKVVVKVRSDQQFVNISVVDTGPGIPENKIPDLFENFWQARKTADQGAGVGLAVVKTIVEAHGGAVKVDSHSGHGSTFTFSLPRRRPVGAHLKKPAAPVVRYSRSQGQSDMDFLA